jgi:hypothetical protein
MPELDVRRLDRDRDVPFTQSSNQKIAVCEMGVNRHCAAKIPRCACQERVNCTHYRAAALLSASPHLAESIRAAKRFRVVPTTD